MISTPSDPGFAFPQSVETWGGLTKREYYAAHAPISLEDAIQSLEVSGTAATHERAYIRLAWMRFAYADAMIAAGKKPV